MNPLYFWSLHCELMIWFHWNLTISRFVSNIVNLWNQNDKKNEVFKPSKRYGSITPIKKRRLRVFDSILFVFLPDISLDDTVLPHTLRKINMEPENTILEKENHLPNHHFQVHILPEKKTIKIWVPMIAHRPHGRSLFWTFLRRLDNFLTSDGAWTQQKTRVVSRGWLGYIGDDILLS